MLREIFRTVPLSYWKEGEHVTGLNIIWNPSLIPPYIETLNTPIGLLITRVPIEDTGTEMLTIYLLCTMGTKYHPGWDVVAWRYDGQNGKEIAKYDIRFVGEALALYAARNARSGSLWYSSGGGGSLYRFHFDPKVTAPPNDGPELEPDEKWIAVDRLVGGIDETVSYTKFQNLPMLGGSWAIDDAEGVGDTFLTNVGRGGGVAAIGVWTWTTGKWRYDLTMPAPIVDICLEDASHAYILLQNRVVVLLDYVRGEILGATKIPPTISGLQAFYNVRIAWDDQHRRILLFEVTPDKADGSATACVRGYRLVPEPIRITTPIPLEVPRQGRTIPVLVQVVGDMNEGVGGYAVTATVTGAGSLVGVPITDHYGNARIQVECHGLPEGSGS